ncbi:MAG: hypothetical protein LBE78_13265 [Burkholderiaceae bacterium]|nr:hypothetical protein [Burkholderiaceae bacterium]
MLNATRGGNNSGSLNMFGRAMERNSTYSFSYGLMKFDVGKDPTVQKFLLSNGFTQQQLNLLNRPGDLAPDLLEDLNEQLQEINKDKIDVFVGAQLQNSITQVDSLIDILQITNPVVAQTIVDSPELQMRIAIYNSINHVCGYSTAVDPSNPFANYLSGTILTGDRTKLPESDMESLQEQLKDALSQFLTGAHQQDTGMSTSLSTAGRTGTLLEQGTGAGVPVPMQIDQLGVNPPAVMYRTHVCEGLF